jgi:hypothetical protein
MLFGAQAHSAISTGSVCRDSSHYRRQHYIGLTAGLPNLCHRGALALGMLSFFAEGLNGFFVL